ncbi:nickel ABC transporter substrate-binding protein [Paenibacillus sp. 481]|uniref:nickel ABC transporter substrate-binding protein n=1 Tax=Paenibacillus sp. 481 TaxID=2835869 RepID=UPI001E2B3056|nr:nickel ABC transporter substrate-binding protein [Paenibacillus sp. 481]
MGMGVAMLTLLSLGLAVTACGGSEQASQSNKKVTLIYNLTFDTLNPHHNWVALRAGAVETLVRLDENVQLSPWLATDWKAIDDRTWTFTIRTDVQFHDGTKLDASAVKASLERASKESKSVTKALNIEKMDANEQQLTIVTKTPHPALPSELVNPVTAIVNTVAEQKMGAEQFNRAPIGTGPFQVSQFTPDSEVQLKRYDQYWDGVAKLDEVSFKFNDDANVRTLALQAKEADIVYHLPAESLTVVDEDRELTVESVPGLRVHFLMYHLQRPHIGDVNVRRALDHLIDRTTIAEQIMLGHAAPANGPFHSSLPFGSKVPHREFNHQKAEELLLQAGYTKGTDGKLTKDGKPLKLRLITYKVRPELPLIGQLLQAEAAKIGISIELKMVENPDTYMRENEDWDLVTYSNLSAPRGDGGYFLNSAFMNGGALNPAQIHIDPLEAVLKQLNQQKDADERIRLSQEAVQIINEEIPHSYAVYPNILVGVNKRVINWKPGADEYYFITNKMDVRSNVTAR